MRKKNGKTNRKTNNQDRVPKARRPQNPSGSSFAPTITPWLSLRNSARAVDFYKSAFGAKEVFRLEGDGGSLVARLSVEGAEFWLSDESPEHGNFSPQSLGGGTVRIILTVADPDAVFARALAAGASQVFPVTEEHGWRLGRVVDPFGHHWEIGRPLETGS
jgi:PhnB protein